MKDVDLIIEAVIDDLQIKQDLFQRKCMALLLPSECRIMLFK